MNSTAIEIANEINAIMNDIIAHTILKGNVEEAIEMLEDEIDPTTGMISGLESQHPQLKQIAELYQRMYEVLAGVPEAVEEFIEEFDTSDRPDSIAREWQISVDEISYDELSPENRAYAIEQFRFGAWKSFRQGVKYANKKGLIPLDHGRKAVAAKWLESEEMRVWEAILAERFAKGNRQAQRWMQS